MSSHREGRKLRFATGGDSGAGPQSMMWPGGKPFAEDLSQQAAELCRRLVTEREAQLAVLHSQLVQERDGLKAENARLSKELAARGRAARPQDAATLPAESSSVASAPVGEATPLNRQATYGEAGADADSQTDMAPPAPVRLDSGTSETHVLEKVFRRLDRRRVGRVTAQDLVAELEHQEHLSAGKRNGLIPNIRTIIRAVNKELVTNAEKKVYSTHSGSLARETRLNHPGELSFEGFKFLLLEDEFEKVVPPDMADIVQEIREMYVRWTTETMIMERTQIDKEDLRVEREVSNLPPWLEPSIGILILLNAACIGISLDVWQDSLLWSIVEIFFSFAFLLELIIKVCCIGFKEHFLGFGFLWNWFDFCIVAIATLDVCFMVLNWLEIHGLPDLNSVTIVRLVRLVRMARLVRLIRMKLFKELTLMIYGVIGGLRTLLWAFVLLFVLVFTLAVIMRQQVAYANISCIELLDMGSDCTPAEEFLVTHTDDLFSNVCRSMFTVFRCLIGDCSAPDGMPLAPHLMNVFGAAWALGYVLTVCFVLFGVFNLVMAIFVENTLETARQSQAKRQMARTKEHVRVAQELRDIVLRICTRDKSSSRCTRTETSKSSLLHWFSRSSTTCAEAAPEEEETLQMAVSRPQFEEVMCDAKVASVLEDLDITVTSPSKLFDVIDSNGSGQLDVGELIEGLMKLRGPADKSDVVCASLMVRSVQRELQRLEVAMMERHRVLQTAQTQILASLNSQELTDEPASQNGPKWGWW